MARKTLSELLAETQGSPVRFRGREVIAVYRLAASTPMMLRIHRARAVASPRQAVRLTIEGGRFTVNGQELSRVVLWSDTAPREVEVAVRPEGRSALIKVWNSWEDEAGVMQSWIGDAGIVVTQHGDRVRLSCSDGVGDPDFEDLVIEIDSVPGRGAI